MKDYLYTLKYSPIKGAFNLCREKELDPGRGFITLSEFCDQQEFDLFILYVRARFKRQFDYDGFKPTVKVTGAQMVEAFRTFNDYNKLLKGKE